MIDNTTPIIPRSIVQKGVQIETQEAEYQEAVTPQGEGLRRNPYHFSGLAEERAAKKHGQRRSDWA